MFTRGEEVKAANVSMKDTLIRLKDGESITVRILGNNDWIEYDAHGAFDLGIYPQSCNGNEDCPLCIAADKGGEKYKSLFAKKKWLVAFYDLATKSIKVFDASRRQATSLTNTVKEYAEDLNDYAFKLSRTGNGTSTVYTLQPVLKMNATEKKVFADAEEITVTDDYFKEVWDARTSSKAFQVKLLEDAKFPIDTFFDEELVKEARKIGEEESKVIEIKDIKDDDLPF